MDGKRCKRCGELKPLDDFYANKGGRQGKRPECKVCTLEEKAWRHALNPEAARERTRRWQAENPDRVKAKKAEYAADGRRALSNRRSHLKRKHGITLEEYDEKLAEQGGVCAICAREPRPGISLHVDHSHTTGKLRGLLCFQCNVAIGLVREDHDRLDAIRRYLDTHDPEVLANREIVVARVGALPPPAWKRSA